MASLREIKEHIASVRSTLKITSAMRLVASAKLRKAQQAAESVRPYTEALSEMLARVMDAPEKVGDTLPQSCDSLEVERRGVVAIVAVASNSSLCGAFNINVIHKTLEEISSLKAEGFEAEVFSVGRKMAEAMRKAGYPSPEDYSALVGHNSFEGSAAFARSLIDAYNSGRYSRIIFIYNHFVSTASQKVTVEQYLPFERTASSGIPSSDRLATEPDFILEPSREEILATLLPQVMRLRVHTVLLDSIAAEHAARTVAMQAASDNAEDLLGELTLEYNKGRQQKITSEILDIVGGSQQ